VAEGRNFSLVQNIEIGSGSHPISFSVGTGFLFCVKKSQGRKLMTHLHLVQRLKVREAICFMRRIVCKSLFIIQRFVKQQDFCLLEFNDVWSGR
jgi:hypothetical protein